MNNQSYIHCKGYDIEIRSRANADCLTDPFVTLDFSASDSSSGICLFLSEDQANEAIIKLSNAVTALQELMKAARAEKATAAELGLTDPEVAAEFEQEASS